MVNRFLISGMNRLSPWIVRGSAPVAIAAARAEPFVTEPEWLEDLKLFATGWIGGLIFFGTLLG
jgi:hypothetical protein